MAAAQQHMPPLQSLQLCNKSNICRRSASVFVGNNARLPPAVVAQHKAATIMLGAAKADGAAKAGSDASIAHVMRALCCSLSARSEQPPNSSDACQEASRVFWFCMRQLQLDGDVCSAEFLPEWQEQQNAWPDFAAGAACCPQYIRFRPAHCAPLRPSAATSPI